MQIEQVLTNLLENAAKYSPAGTPITVRGGRGARRGRAGRCAIAVADQGVGIPRAEQDRIFDKFYRVASPARARPAGRAWAWPSSRAWSRRNGGRVSVASTPGEGSTFTVLLPVEEGAAALSAHADAVTGRGAR